VPIPFAFPYQGKVFTNSWMFDNGVVGFMDPTAGFNGAQNWNSQPMANLGPQFSYMIFPMWADIAPTGSTQYLVNASSESQTYTWKNISEYYSGGSRLNTFSLEIRPDGYFGSTYDKVNLSQTNVSIGYTGDLSKGEYTQIAYHNAGTILNQIQPWSVTGTGNLCASNPLSDPSCPGYADALFQQQCSANVFYNPACPGYTEAYHSYMCSQDPLYSLTCPGYEAAYFQYNCSLDPLYSLTCPGYQQAYYNQQCSLNPLYDSGCTGYQQAYYNQQCSLNPLYDSGCIGYQQAYQQKLFNDACTANPQYSSQCPGYTIQIATTSSLIVASADPIASAVTIVDPVTDNVMVVPTTSSTTSVSPAAVVSVIQPQQNTVVQSLSVAPAERKESKSETKAETKSESKQDTKPMSPARAAAVQAVKQKQLETAKNLAASLGEAKTQEAQAAAQNAVMATMGYVPGFDSYSRTIREIDFYKPHDIYKNQRTIDNKRSLIQLQGGSDLKHNQLINLQYKE